MVASNLLVFNRYFYCKFVYSVSRVLLAESNCMVVSYSFEL